MAPYSRANANRGSGRRVNRRRNRAKAAVRKIYRRRPTARNQQKQIARVTRLAISNSKRFKSVYTDWQMSNYTTIPASGTTWHIVKLTDFSTWVSKMRMDTNVNESNHTFIKRLQINLSTWTTAGYSQVNMFIVRPRWSAAGDDPSIQGMVAGTDYIEGPSGHGGDVRLNSGKYKVLWSAYKMLTIASIGQTGGNNQLPGDPSESYYRRQVNLPVNMRVSTTNLASWTTKSFDDLPYYNKLYLLVLNSGTGTAVSYDQLATCINKL